LRGTRSTPDSARYRTETNRSRADRSHRCQITGIGRDVRERFSLIHDHASATLISSTRNIAARFGYLTMD
jgi:hypothetical protein